MAPIYLGITSGCGCLCVGVHALFPSHMQNFLEDSKTLSHVLLSLTFSVITARERWDMWIFFKVKFLQSNQNIFWKYLMFVQTHWAKLTINWIWKYSHWLYWVLCHGLQYCSIKCISECHDLNSDFIRSPIASAFTYLRKISPGNWTWTLYSHVTVIT